MKLSEFGVGTQVSIRSSKGLKNITFTTEIIDIKEDKVFVKPILVNGQAVGFNAPDIINVVTVNRKDKAYLYNSIKITYVMSPKLPDGSAHCIATTEEENVTPVNRRNYYRVFMGIVGKMQTGFHKEPSEITIRDLSAKGIGIICPRSAEVEVGSEIYVSFHDRDTNTKFKIKCTVVRCTRVDASTVLCGCQLPKFSDSLSRYVAKKQQRNRK
ncbi:MAG: PilZ domain-containing protein [Butyribacter sp.]|nr:PilZ domain-containing protein [bacterium]MDY3853563.1 PilZ domain-containing protein [Butyribacter sp.]